MTDLWILGAGGFAKEVCWLARATGKFNVRGFFDLSGGYETVIGNISYPVLPEGAIATLKKGSALAIGSGDPHVIAKLSARYKEEWPFPNLIHPTMTGDEHGVTMGIGNIITSNTMFTTAIRIGSFNVFNLTCTIGHDCIIGDANVINPSANISGSVTIGNNNLIGTNATVLQGLNIGDDCRIGAGSVVTKDVASGLTVVGVPAKTLAPTERTNGAKGKSKPSLILVGGGGHCRAVIDVIEAEGKWRIEGVLDREEFVGDDVLGHPIIGTDVRIAELVAEGHSMLVTAGQIKDASLRVRLFDLVAKAGGSLATVVSPSARLATGATLGAGTVVGHYAIVNSAAHIGGNCILNTGAVVEHDSVIGDHCHISTGAIINGDCTVGARTFIGSRAILLQSVQVGEDCVVGAGTVVLKDVQNGSTVVGQPAREL